MRREYKKKDLVESFLGIEKTFSSEAPAVIFPSKFSVSSCFQKVIRLFQNLFCYWLWKHVGMKRQTLEALLFFYNYIYRLYL